MIFLEIRKKNDKILFDNLWNDKISIYRTISTVNYICMIFRHIISVDIKPKYEQSMIVFLFISYV